MALNGVLGDLSAGEDATGGAALAWLAFRFMGI